MSNPLMKCGHTANAVRTNTNEPVCVICIGIVPGADEVAESLPDLSNRKARCVYGDREVDSSFELAFFEHRPDAIADEYYCGCKGWD